MIEEKVKISVIIPVYNAEKYINQCVESIRKQSYRNIEIILVDDGSTDESSRLCDELAGKDKRIVVFHKDNEGPAIARNLGITSAKGDYIMFVDSDDYLYSTTNIEKIVERIDKNHADLLMYNVGTYWEQEKRLVKEGNQISEKLIDECHFRNIFAFLLSKGMIYSGILAKVLNRSVMLEKKLFYESGECEDIPWSLKVYQEVDTIDWCDDLVYIYRKQGGESRSSKPFVHENLLPVKRICLQAKNLKIRKEGVMDYIAYLYVVWLGQASLSKDRRVKKDIEDMKAAVCLLKHDIHPSVKLSRRVYRILGYKALCFLLGVYMKMLYKL